MQLRQSISMARSIRFLLIPIAVISVIVAIYLWSQQVKVEPAWQWAGDLPTFHQVAGDDVVKAFVPVDRKFTAVTNKGAVVGKWTTHPVSTGEMVHPSQLMASTPNRFRFDGSGEELPLGTYGYYMAVPVNVLAEITHRELLSLSIIDEEADELIVVVDRVDVLQKEEGGVWLGLTMNQIASVEALKRRVETEAQEGAGEGGEGEHQQSDTDQGQSVLWTITQRANPDLPPLAVFEMEFTAEGFDWEEARE